jgi:16S rRNA (uracil1498-N3)-methyltransferase
MPRTRLYIEGPIDAADDIEISGDQARYISRVLRLRPEDHLILFDGSGAEYAAIIRTLGKDRITATITEKIDRCVESSLQIHLLQGISRGERMDFVVQKATELGVERITPVLTEYSVVRLDDKRAAKRVQHWQGVATSACEQSGRNVPPLVDSPIKLRNWLGENPGDKRPRLILKPGARKSLRSVCPADNHLTVLIGPEGGFSDEEYELASVAGFCPVGFGPRVLRTETAALAVVAGLQTLYGDLAPEP